MTATSASTPKPVHGATVPIWKKLDLLEHSPVPCDFAVGDKVTYTNDAGLKFPMEIVGFSGPHGHLRGGFIHLKRADRDSLDGVAWWVPHTESEIKRT